MAGANKMEGHLNKDHQDLEYKQKKLLVTLTSPLRLIKSLVNSSMKLRQNLNTTTQNQQLLDGC